MAEPKTIYCPECGRKVSRWDGRGTMNIVAKCNKCNELVVYIASSDTTVIKKIPPRQTSSGKRFY